MAADAIVNAANSALAGGGGVDGAIHRAGGPAIMADLERRYGPRPPLPDGQCRRQCGRRSCRRAVVIHAVGPIWRGGAAGEAELLASAYRTSLDSRRGRGRGASRSRRSRPASTAIRSTLAAAVALQTVDAWIAEHPDALDR